MLSSEGFPSGATVGYAKSQVRDILKAEFNKSVELQVNLSQLDEFSCPVNSSMKQTLFKFDKNSIKLTQTVFICLFHCHKLLCSQNKSLIFHPTPKLISWQWERSHLNIFSEVASIQKDLHICAHFCVKVVIDLDQSAKSPWYCILCCETCLHRSLSVSDLFTT